MTMMGRFWPPAFLSANNFLLCFVFFPLETILAREGYRVVSVVSIILLLVIRGLGMLNMMWCVTHTL